MGRRVSDWKRACQGLLDQLISFLDCKDNNLIQSFVKIFDVYTILNVCWYPILIYSKIELFPPKVLCQNFSAQSSGISVQKFKKFSKLLTTLRTFRVIRTRENLKCWGNYCVPWKSVVYKQLKFYAPVSGAILSKFASWSDCLVFLALLFSYMILKLC